MSSWLKTHKTAIPCILATFSYVDYKGLIKIWLIFNISRLKKIQEKKKKIRAETEAKVAALKAKNQFQEASSLLNEERDEDLLFND